MATEVPTSLAPTEINAALQRSTALFKTYKPVTPGIRHLRRPLNPHLWPGRPVRLLTVPLRKKGGRNAHGRVTIRGRGGGHKRRIRIVDFVRDEPGIHDVVRVEYDPNRSAHIALVRNRDPNATGRKKWSYILAPEGIRAGAQVESFRRGFPDGLVPGFVNDTSKKGVVASTNDTSASSSSLTMGLLRARTIRPGNVLPLRLIPNGTIIHSIALHPDGRGILVRSAGTWGQVMEPDVNGKHMRVRLQSGEVRRILLDCVATVGKVSNPLWKGRVLGKAGRNRWLGNRPKVRGVAMNAYVSLLVFPPAVCECINLILNSFSFSSNEHPHGGGRGKSKSNKHPRSPWGWNTKGKRTRKPGPDGPKNSNKMVISERPRGRERRGQVLIT